MIVLFAALISMGTISPVSANSQMGQAKSDSTQWERGDLREKVVDKPLLAIGTTQFEEDILSEKDIQDIQVTFPPRDLEQTFTDSTEVSAGEQTGVVSFNENERQAFAKEKEVELLREDDLVMANVNGDVRNINRHVALTKVGDSPLQRHREWQKEIPSGIAQTKNSLEEISDIVLFSLVILIMVMVVVGLSSFLLSRRRFNGCQVDEDPYEIKVLAQHSLGSRKSLVIVRVAGESILLAITNTHVSMVKTLSFIDNEISQEVPQKEGVVFSGELNEPIIDSPRGRIEDDEFSFVKMRDTISEKLKDMRSL